MVRRGVYPRACGGTEGVTRLKFLYEGLSPRLRGNLGDRGVDEVRCGSIPAPAGEPVGCR